MAVPRRGGLCLLMLAALALGEGALAQERSRELPITLEQVHRSVRRFILPRLSARFQRELASARSLGAAGAFDLKVVGEGGADPAGKYTRPFGKLALKQRIPFQGLSIESGYRNGARHPVYDSRRETSTAGELFGAVNLPLLRDGSIDQQRLELAQAALGEDIAETAQSKQQLEVILEASLAYQQWVKSSAYLEIEQRLLALAKGRAGLVESSVAAGQLPRVELLDNERLIAERQEHLLQATAEAAQLAHSLSFYLRDSQGRPLRGTAPPSAQTPAELPNFNAQQAARRAERQHPVLLAMALKRRQLRQSLQFADNQQLARLDLGAKLSKDFGQERVYAPALATQNQTEVQLSLSLDWPIQRRKARGKQQEQRIKLKTLEAEAQLFREQLLVQLSATQQRLELVHNRMRAARAAADAARSLADAERERFSEGLGTIFMINQREKVAADTAKRVAQVSYEYQSLLAKWRYLSGDVSGEGSL